MKLAVHIIVFFIKVYIIKLCVLYCTLQFIVYYSDSLFYSIETF